MGSLLTAGGSLPAQPRGGAEWLTADRSGSPDDRSLVRRPVGVALALGVGVALARWGCIKMVPRA